jgi:hypothetical protein
MVRHYSRRANTKPPSIITTGHISGAKSLKKSQLYSTYNTAFGILCMYFIFRFVSFTPELSVVASSWHKLQGTIWKGWTRLRRSKEGSFRALKFIAINSRFNPVGLTAIGTQVATCLFTSRLMK